MNDRIGEVLRTFPPRPLNPDERAQVATWFAATCDVASAYVSERRSDDPALYRRIVISVGPERRPSFLIHAPSGISCWLVSEVGPDPQVRRFDTLRAALNAVRPVFVLSAAEAAV
jgi:hypothetical protein